MTRPPPTSLAAGARLLTMLASLLLACSAPAQAQGVVYVSSEKDNALAIVDLKTLTVTGSLPTCKRPRHVFCPRGAHRR